MTERRINELAVAAVKEVRKLLTPLTAWTQRAMARDGDRYQVEPRHTGACCWCLVGAIRKVCPVGGAVRHRVYEMLTNRPLSGTPYSQSAGAACDELMEWNDRPETTHAHVLERLDLVIETQERALAAG